MAYIFIMPSSCVVVEQINLLQVSLSTDRQADRQRDRQAGRTDRLTNPTTVPSLCMHVKGNKLTHTSGSPTSDPICSVRWKRMVLAVRYGLSSAFGDGTMAV